MSKDVLLVIKVAEGYRLSDERKAEIIKELSEQKNQDVIILPRSVEFVGHIEVENADDSSEAYPPRCGDCQWCILSALGGHACVRTTQTIDSVSRTVKMVKISDIACNSFKPKGGQNND